MKKLYYSSFIFYGQGGNRNEYWYGTCYYYRRTAGRASHIVYYPWNAGDPLLENLPEGTV